MRLLLHCILLQIIYKSIQASQNIFKLMVFILFNFILKQSQFEFKVFSHLFYFFDSHFFLAVIIIITIYFIIGIVGIHEPNSVFCLHNSILVLRLVPVVQAKVCSVQIKAFFTPINLILANSPNLAFFSTIPGTILALYNYRYDYYTLLQGNFLFFLPQQH